MIISIYCCILGEAKKAKKSLQWLRGPDTDISQEFGEIEKSAQQHGMSEDSPGFKSLFNKIYIKPLFISLGLMFFQQMTGINAFMFYTVQIFQVSEQDKFIFVIAI